ncbi:putative ACT domain-containing protein ACR8 [Iris pallida]|uniref:ACT domain-containing protein ACR n=1 Tax=Iris pallida TaxID=29817 RepID=A0AAX6GDS3_IRIPA|nr:putative ACT domain-containing protein ACR8 [Iris pallida]
MSCSVLVKANQMETETEWPSYLDEYQKLVIRMNTPRVVVDNAASSSATLVKVDSARSHAFLLDTVQVLTDLNLSVVKAYITSDGAYSMDVFHVTDQHGRKLTDSDAISHIQHSLQSPIRPSEGCRYHRGQGPTALELTGPDRPGLLSEVFAVLSDLDCAVTAARVWTHNGRAASIVSVDGIGAAAGPGKVESTLAHLLRGSAVLSSAPCHPDRRLHQMMFLDRDYQRCCREEEAPPPAPAVSVSVQNLVERGYSVVNVSCRNRPKLLFDVLCTLTDMEYVVFHGTVDTDDAAAGGTARLEFYVRHSDGTPIGSEAERQRVILLASGHRAKVVRRSDVGIIRRRQRRRRPAGASDGGHQDPARERAVGGQSGPHHLYSRACSMSRTRPVKCRMPRRWTRSAEGSDRAACGSRTRRFGRVCPSPRASGTRRTARRTRTEGAASVFASRGCGAKESVQLWLLDQVLFLGSSLSSSGTYYYTE